MWLSKWKNIVKDSLTLMTKGTSQSKVKEILIATELNPIIIIKEIIKKFN